MLALVTPLIQFFLLQLVACIVFIVLTQNTSPSHDSWMPATLLGICSVHPTLLAAWLAFGRQALIYRAPLSVVGIFASALLAFAGWQLIERGTPYWAYFVIIGAAFIQWILILAPCLLARIQFGWRIRQLPAHQLLPPRVRFDVDSEDPAAQPDSYTSENADDVVEPEGANAELQFGIRHLLFWTTLTALILGLLRFLIVGQELRFLAQRMKEPAQIFLIMSTFHALIGLPAIPVMLGRGRWLGRVGLWSLLFAVYTMVLSYVEWRLFRRIGTPMELQWVVYMNPISATLTLAALAIARRPGLRLVRRIR